jgi:hypothetical protein
MILFFCYNLILFAFPGYGCRLINTMRAVFKVDYALPPGKPIATALWYAKVKGTA